MVVPNVPTSHVWLGHGSVPPSRVAWEIPTPLATLSPLSSRHHPIRKATIDVLVKRAPRRLHQGLRKLLLLSPQRPLFRSRCKLPPRLCQLRHHRLRLIQPSDGRNRRLHLLTQDQCRLSILRRNFPCLDVLHVPGVRLRGHYLSPQSKRRNLLQRR